MLSLLAAAAPAADNLAQVQAGFSGSHEIDYGAIRLVVGIILAILVLGAAVALVRRALRTRHRRSGWSSITNQSHIWDILSRAVSRLAGVTIELYETDHSLSYKGAIDSLEGDNLLVISLSETPSADMDFKELPGVLHLNFRPAPKEPMEHYQFSTRVVDSRFVRTKQGFRECQLLVPVPKVLTSAQRRSFLRLEPKEPFALECRLHEVPEDVFPGLDNLARVTDGQVMDISIGGCQLKIEPPSAIKETQRFVGVMDLPAGDLGGDLKKPVLVILMQILSKDRVEGLDGTGQAPASILRMRFLGRYLQDPLQKNWIYRGITSDSLDDLAHWLQAYQRFIIKKRRNLLPADSSSMRPPNMFPSTPPERPPLKDA
ncbi:MAG: hypothetical protein LBR80_01095 [Deltaproteobacteria bacterium]|jgi:hypothetical protein|nr:hypothetical protein [Deltaproteobacteria bacterium]